MSIRHLPRDPRRSPSLKVGVAHTSALFATVARVEPSAEVHPTATEPVTGPFLYTFTLRLPFILGMADGLDHDVSLPVAYADEEHDETFGRAPFVRVRMFNATIPDLGFLPPICHRPWSTFTGRASNRATRRIITSTSSGSR